MSFLSLQLSPSGSWAAWLVWIAMAACIGGVFIFVGLSMEKCASKQPSFTKKSKSLESCGEWIVMVGVLIEIFSTGAFAIRGEMETRQIKAQEAKNDPMNQPIVSISATAFLHGTNLINRQRSLINAIIAIGTKDSFINPNLSEQFHLLCYQLNTASYADEWRMGFEPSPDLIKNFSECFRGKSASYIASNMNFLTIRMASSSTNGAWISGNVIVYVNGVIQKQFDLENGPGLQTSYGGIPFWELIATNKTEGATDLK